MNGACKRIDSVNHRGQSASGLEGRFGTDWPGQQCGAGTRQGQPLSFWTYMMWIGQFMSVSGNSRADDALCGVCGPMRVRGAKIFALCFSL